MFARFSHDWKNGGKTTHLVRHYRSRSEVYCEGNTFFINKDSEGQKSALNFATPLNLDEAFTNIYND